MDYKVGKTGDINQKDGLKIYFFNESEVIATIKLYNFDYLSYLKETICDIIPETNDFNYQNCLLFFNLEVNEKYRRQGYGSILMNEVEKYSKKININFILGHRDFNNDTAEIFWSKLNYQKLGSDDKIEVFFKKI
jgi:GNAT superfamily N-acetyltransferase